MTTFQKMKNFLPVPGADVNMSFAIGLFPALDLLGQTPQDPYYHPEGNVLTHTGMVIEEIVSGETYANANFKQRFVLFYAALLHDIAKYSTTVINKATGSISQPHHSERGAIDVRILLWRAGVPFDIREHICRLISVHQLPFFLIDNDRAKRDPVFVLHKLSCELDLRLLAALAEADMLGRTYEKKWEALKEIEKFRKKATELGVYGSPLTCADKHTGVMYFRGAKIWPYHRFHKTDGSRVKVLAGLPATGKDRFCSEMYPVISFDDAREELGLKHGEKSAGKAVHLVHDRARELLRKKSPFVWNATHISPLNRKRTLDLLYDYHAEVEIIYLEEPPEVVFKRNSTRDTTLTNKALEKMLMGWDVPLPTEADNVSYLISGQSVSTGYWKEEEKLMPG